MNPFLAELAATPWAIIPARLTSLLEALNGVDLRGERLEQLAAARADRPVGGVDPGPAIADGVATITIAGMLMKSVPWWMDLLGITATSYDRIAQALAAAEADPAVASIVLAVDSPGGQAVSAMHDVTDAIAAAAKPVTVYVTDLAGSAAYMLASQAARIYAGAGAMVGSIGTFTVAVDSSRAAENDGVKVHVISSGPLKGGAAGAPISSAQLDALQRNVDQQAGMFADAVAAGRGLSEAQVAELATGDVWLAAAALERGLIDGIATVRQSADAAASASNRAVAAAITTHPAGATPADKEAQPMLSAARLAELCKANASFPPIVTLILDMNAAVDETDKAKPKPKHSEAEILAAIEQAKTKDLATKAELLATALETERASHKASVKERDDKLAALTTELAELKAKHGKLATLAAGAPADPGADGTDATDKTKGKLPRFTFAQASAGAIPADVLKSGNYELVAAP